MNVRLERASADDVKRIKPLFMSAFPKEERPPFFVVRRRAAQGRAELLAAKDGERFVGFVYLIGTSELVYLFFLAVDSELRGQGVGSAILAALKERYASGRIFLAREQLDPQESNYAERVRRHRFYLHNGFSDLPCKIKEAGVVYDAMGVGGDVAPEEYDAIVTAWAGRIGKRVIDMRMVL